MSHVQIGKVALVCVALSSFPAAFGMTISGMAPSTATVGSRYFWRPTVTGADRTTLQFAYVNRPRWSSIYRSSGAIIGVPTQPGVYSNIRIMAGDGIHFVETPPFTITVDAASPIEPVLKISGMPPTKATAGNFYSFTPTVIEAPASALRYSITGKPNWAQFNSISGSLSGTPGTGSAGTDENIVISVASDALSASLPAFDIAVANPTGAVTRADLNWTPPTRNVDGSALTNLAGYIVRYGENADSLTNKIPLPASVTDAEVANLSSGTWYFEVAAINAQNVASRFSEALSKSVP